MSEKFDEHEHDTARRAYPQEIVDGTKRTTKMARLDLDGLRTESGTRPALTHDAIERHVREKIDDALAGVEREDDSAADPHSRPTIEAGVFGAMPTNPEAAAWLATGAVIAAAPASAPALTPPASASPASLGPASRPTPLASSSSIAPPRRAPIAGWVVAFVLLGLVMMVSAAGAAGFVLGRRSATR
ncbi:MAG: hypothetical protein KF764_20345 [Labilithrix sp.]|nr:hypothetical protein [Labilithrix sp.]